MVGISSSHHRCKVEPKIILFQDRITLRFNELPEHSRFGAINFPLVEPARNYLHQGWVLLPIYVSEHMPNRSDQSYGSDQCHSEPEFIGFFFKPFKAVLHVSQHRSAYHSRRLVSIWQPLIVRFHITHNKQNCEGVRRQTANLSVQYFPRVREIQGAQALEPPHCLPASQRRQKFLRSFPQSGMARFGSDLDQRFQNKPALVHCRMRNLQTRLIH